MALAFAVDGARTGGTAAWLITAALLIMLTLHESTLARAYPQLVASNLPGIPPRPSLRLSPTVIVRTQLALLLWLGVVAMLGWPAAAALVPVAGWTLAAGAAYVMAIGRVGGSEPMAAVRTALEQYRPEFALHFSGPADSLHQVRMWLPFLERVGRPFVIFVRERHAFTELADDGAPVVLVTSLAHLETCVVGSLRVALYVNNGMKNTHLVRFNHLTHIQLLHGDSEKPPSFSPVTAMFDKVFVAGRAGRDRYTRNGVDIPDAKFEIVGRPQVESIAVGPRERQASDPPTVLYAPTWRGQYEDSDFCSLPIAEPMLRSLLSAGARLVFRPHPFSAADPESAAQIATVETMLAEHRDAGGPDHVFGEAAAAEPIVDQFNAADALVADLSSVVSDFLFSGRPFAVTNMHDDPTFAEQYPIVAASYVVPGDGSGLAPLWADMLGADPLAQERAAVRSYYLGPFPAETYAEAFVDAVRRAIDTTPVAASHEHDQESPALPDATADDDAAAED